MECICSACLPSPACCMCVGSCRTAFISLQRLRRQLAIKQGARDDVLEQFGVLLHCKVELLSSEPEAQVSITAAASRLRLCTSQCMSLACSARCCAHAGGAGSVKGWPSRRTQGSGSVLRTGHWLVRCRELPAGHCRPGPAPGPLPELQLMLRMLNYSVQDVLAAASALTPLVQKCRPSAVSSDAMPHNQPVARKVGDCQWHPLLRLQNLMAIAWHCMRPRLICILHICM